MTHENFGGKVIALRVRSSMPDHIDHPGDDAVISARSKNAGNTAHASQSVSLVFQSLVNGMERPVSFFLMGLALIRHEPKREELYAQQK